MRLRPLSLIPVFICSSLSSDWGPLSIKATKSGEAEGLRTLNPVSVHAAPVEVTPPDVLIRAHVNNGANCGRDSRTFCGTLQVRYGLERYFVSEGEGRNLETARNQRRLTIIAAVAPTGRAPSNAC